MFFSPPPTGRFTRRESGERGSRLSLVARTATSESELSFYNLDISLSEGGYNLGDINEEYLSKQGKPKTKIGNSEN